MSRRDDPFDFGIEEELDSPVDWAFLAGAREGQPTPAIYHCSREGSRASQSAIGDGQVTG
jgi:hypothetical protein